jgi:hypothetical protein
VFSFSASTTAMEVVNAPRNDAYQALVAITEDVGFADDFETDMGWTVDNDAALTAGAWERAVPAGDGLRGDPTVDGDGSGQCYLTENGAGNTDVDGGHSILTSPTMDATVVSGTPFISYWRWYSSDQGTPDDLFVVEISNNDGGNWTQLEVLGPEGIRGEWVQRVLKIEDFLMPTDQMRIRFDVGDTNTGSIVEAAVDGVRIVGLACGELPCPGDLNGDGVVDMSDYMIAQSRWGSGEFDVNVDGLNNIIDLMVMGDSFGDCP